MRLKDTLSADQYVELLSGQPVGFFPYMILQGDSFYSKLYDLCLGYYIHKSGEKSISPTYVKLRELVSSDINITKPADQFLGEIIRGKFIDKWERVYDTLNLDYEVLEEHAGSSKRTGSHAESKTEETTKTKTGDNHDNTTYDTAVEDNGKTGTHETTTRQVATSDNVYGFNSTSAVGDTTSDEDTTETLIGDPDTNTTHNTQTKTGTEQRVIGISESEKLAGDSTTHGETGETFERNYRDVEGSKLIDAELRMRNKQLFFDIVYKDIDSIAVLQIYI